MANIRRQKASQQKGGKRLDFEKKKKNVGDRYWGKPENTAIGN